MTKKIRQKNKTKKRKVAKKGKKVIKRKVESRRKKIVSTSIRRKGGKQPKPKKLTYAEKKAENLDRLSSLLIEKGRKRGFITYDEILKTFPDIENNILFLDELYEKFGVAGIDVL